MSDQKLNPNQRNNNDEESQVGKVIRSVLIWIGIFAFVIVVFMLYKGGERPEYEVTYTEYMKLIQDDKILEATIVKSGLNSYEFHGVLREKLTMNRDNGAKEVQAIRTSLGFVDKSTEELWSSKGIKWKYEEEDGSFWSVVISFLPWIALIAVYIIVMRRMQMGGGGKNIFSFGKARTRMLNESQRKVTFLDVAGADEAKYELQEVVDFLREPLKYQRLGGKIPRGVLLLGPPGTGKTLLARAVAGEANVPFFSISGADFVEMFVGVGASRVRDLFEQAKRNAPCIIFIDEIDAVGRQRGAGLGGGHDEREQTLNMLLVEMDGFEQNNGIIIIAATNRPDVLDPALLRPGRFDRQVVVDRPDVKGREGILKVHTRNIPLSEDVNLNSIARGTPGLSGADLENIVNEAALFAARRNSMFVTNEDFEMAKDKVIMGVERKSMVLSEFEKKTTAYHEIGHALLGKLLPNADPVHKVTIIPRGRALGVTYHLPKEDAHSLSKAYLEDQLVIFMGGRAAEKLVFNQFTTGASNDLERATNIARKMVCEWGMIESVGPIKYGNKQEEVFLGREISGGKEYSEKTAQELDDQIKSILTNAATKAEKLLVENMEMLHTLALALLERETIDGDELDKLMRGEALPPVAEKKNKGIPPEILAAEQAKAASANQTSFN